MYIRFTPMQWDNSPHEREFIVIISIFSIGLGFVFSGSTLLILIMLFGIGIALIMNSVETGGII